MDGTVYLNTDSKMPLLGLGLYQATGTNEAEYAIMDAIHAGYRMIDTAPVYKNEEAIARGIERCAVSRKELFITSKVWNTAQRVGDVRGAFERSLDRLRLDYVDLYLIHWPVPGCYLSTWLELEHILNSGRVSSIGVSNFQIHHLEELKKVSGIVPAVNQVECHPLCFPKALFEYCKNNGIVMQAYSPLARGAYLDHDIICVIATKYGRTPAQIGLRWMVQKGISVIPKSVHRDRIFENAGIFDFEISDEDMAIMDGMNEDLHTFDIPEDLKGITW